MHEKNRTLDLKFDTKDKDYLIWNNQIVMSRTENDYFKKLFDRIRSAGILTKNVLEIGFGLGISAELIQENLSPRSHCIIEIDKGVYKDLVEFSHTHSSVIPMLGDWRSFALQAGEYDFVFHDSYDYSGAEGWVRDESFNDYEEFKKILKPDGYICHPHFGDGSVKEIAGFETIILDRLEVNPILMWDRTWCSDAAVVLRKPIRLGAVSPLRLA